MSELVKLDQSRLHDYSILLQSVFQKNYFSKEYLKWQYFDNPLGPAVGFDYVFNGSVVAHYACIPISISGSDSQYLLSLNTATRPDFQGKGLFKKLANCTYEYASTEFQGVLGVANSQSFPGFIRSLGFQHIGNLDLRWGSLNRGSVMAQAVDYSDSILRWRLDSPRGGFSSSLTEGGTLVKRRLNPFLPPLSVLLAPASEDSLQEKQEILKFPRNGLTLDWNKHLPSLKGITLPERFKPSPLNLIFQDFQDSSRSSFSPVSTFTFLDFDAF